MQFFIAQYTSGYTKMTYLVRKEVLSIRDHTAKVTLRAEKSIKEHLTREFSTAEKSLTDRFIFQMREVRNTISEAAKKSNVQAVSDNQRERLLASLKFGSMNKRRDQVTDSHRKTFRWIFD